MAFYLWCPKADGTQHIACLTDREVDQYPWGRRVPRSSEIEAYIITDLTVGFATADDFRRGWYRRPIPPTFGGCHFDRIIDEEDTGRWPAHVRAYGEIGEWHWDRARYPLIAAHYQCSVHRTKPVVLKRTSAYNDRWQPIEAQHFTRVWRESTEAEQRIMFGRFYDEMMRMGAPYGLRHLSYSVPNRTVDSSHDLW